MRPASACSTCRARRRKCEIPSPGGPCTSCTAKGIPCSAVQTPRSPFSSRSNLQESSFASSPFDLRAATAPPSDIVLNQQLCSELVDLYFDFIHDKFHSIFHRPTVVEDVLTGRLPAVLTYGMAALSARFSTNLIFLDSDPRKRGIPFARECQRLLDVREISLTTVQAAILLGAAAITDGEAGGESVLYCIACRIAQLLDLPQRPAADRIEREVNVRVWWTLCMIDVWSSAGVGLPRLLAHNDNVPLPSDEAEFLQLRSGERRDSNTEKTRSPASSLLAQMIKLNRLLAEVNNVNERAVAGRMSGVILEDSVKDVSRKLDDWLENLPNNMRDTDANLARYSRQGLGSLFVTLYLGYYHYGQLLFYQFLHEDNHGSVPNAHFYAKKCKEHAANLCTMVYKANSTPGCQVLYNMVGHVLVVASTVQIHNLLYSADEEQIRIAKARLEQNFEFLVRLRSYWPSIDVSFTRLRAFHKACRASMETSFRMDQWMLRFLSEFAKPMDDRVAAEDANDSKYWTLEEIGKSPASIMDLS